MLRRFFLGIGSLLLIISCFGQTTHAVSTERQFKIFYNDHMITFDKVQPVLINGVTLVPFRKVFETLGFEVDWNPETRGVTGIKEGLSIHLTIDHSMAKVNGKDVALQVPARIMNSSTLVPLRFVSENSGKKVDYKFEGDTLYIWISDMESEAYMSKVSCKTGTSSIEGRILAPEGNTGISGARVYLEAADCWATTDAEGAFTFNEVSAQEDKLVATRGRFTTEASVTPGKAATIQLKQGQLNIAYIEGAYDHAEKMVEELGYKADRIGLDQLTEKKLSDYHILFLNCGLYESIDDSKLDVLRNWVASGGALYLSDLSGMELEKLFPEKVKFLGQLGVVGEVKATLEEQSFKNALNKSEATIVFDLSSWMVIDSVSSDTEVLVRGAVEYESYLSDFEVSYDERGNPTDQNELLNQYMDMINDVQTNPEAIDSWMESFNQQTKKDSRPLAVRFQHGKGQVTYTSFHEEAQMSGEMKTLMQNLILGL